LDANVTVDQDFAAGHGLAYMIKQPARAFEANLSRVAHTQTENVADPDAMARCLQFDPLNLCRRLSGNQMWNKL
jgi:hypothetical protein